MIRTIAAALCLAVAAPAWADSEVVASTVKGDPGIRSIDVLGFAPGGVLLVGDGRAAQVVAIMTGDVKPAAPLAARIEGFDAKIAGRLGVGAKDVEIIDLAVNPASGRAYVAVRRQTDKLPVILTVDGGGRIEELPLKDVEHARIPLPQGEQAPVSKVTDVAWAGNRLLAAARANEAFASKIFAADGPIRHGAEGALVSAETYHVAHGKWETKAPMSVLMPFEEAGTAYVVGAFTCTPVVKYPVDAIRPGAKVKGISMIELGSGNRPIDMVTYVKDGKRHVLMNTFRVHHAKKPFGPSPYWAARFDADLLAGRDKVNENAVRRLEGDAPATDRIDLVEAYHGVTQLDLLDERRALVVRATAAGLDLEPLPLP